MVCLLGATQYSFAQKGQREEKVKALKIAFITQRLQLTSEEAQRFWPVYNQYDKEIQKLAENSKDEGVLENEEKLLKIRKKYQPEFQKIIGSARVNALFKAERDFRTLLIKRLKERKKAHQGR